MEVPAGWISETDLRAAIGVVDKDQKKFHRNLVNWRDHGLLPRSYDGHEVPISLPLGFAIGNEAWHPPVMIEMVRRINMLRESGGTIDEWLWQLWIEGLPIDIVAWCRPRLETYAEALSRAEEPQVIRAATRKPAKRTDPRRVVYGRLNVQDWYAFGAWTGSAGAGTRLPQSIFDPVSPPRVALTRLVEPEADDSSIRGRLVGSRIEGMEVSRLLAVLNEADATELEKARKDCQAFAQAAKADHPAGSILARIWRKVNARAGLLPALIELRRSPNHQGDLAAELGLSRQVT